MAAASGRESATLSEELFAHGYRFDFFQAVRLLERMGAMLRAVVRPSGDRWGRICTRARRRCVFAPFRRWPSPPARSVRCAAPAVAHGGEAGPPPEMVVAFLGLTGPSGVLPHHYTSMIIERLRDKDEALRDFLDLFHHRVVSLFYRAWEKYRFAIGYERAELADPPRVRDLFTACLYSLVGFGTAGLGNRLVVDDEALLFYGGHFAHFPRSAIGLELVLADYFAVPVEVRQFEGQWLHLGEEDRTALPSARGARQGASRLGDSLVVGGRVWDVESKFRLRLGPLGYEEFRALMPSGAQLRAVCHLTRTYAGPQFDFDVQPVLRREEVPPIRLGGEGESVAAGLEYVALQSPAGARR